MDTTTQAAAELIKNGILGAVFVIVVIPLGFYALSLAKSLKETQDKRTADAQAVIEKLLQLNDKWNSTITEQIKLVEIIDDTLREVKQALKELRDFMLEKR